MVKSKKIQGLVGQFTLSTLGVVASVLGTIAVFVIASRALGPSEFGKFAFSYAVTSLLGLLLDFGYPVSLLRDIKPSANGGLVEIGKEAFTLKGVLFLALTAGVFLIPFVLNLNFSLVVVLWLGVSLISWGNFFSTMLRAIGMHGRDALNNFCANAAGLTIALLVALFYPNSSMLALVFVGTGSVYLGMTLRVWVKHFCFSSMRIGGRQVLFEARNKSNYVLDAFCRRSFGYLDVAVLGLVAPFASVGFYQAAQKITQSVSIFAQPFNNVLLPKLAQSLGSPEDFQNRKKSAFVVQLIFGFIAGGVLWLFGPAMLLILFSDTFQPAIELFPLFAVLIGSRYVVSAIVISKTAEGFILERLFASLSGVVFFLVFGSIFAYFEGARGLLFALITSTFSTAIVLLALTKGKSP